ncbi:unnamed protein product [Protopolystoma xenopodis]|uniref:Uncharacterized protein n=1 Tax=Protopolystoma xenopodis TaxID=117903 RepID=A0A3S5C3E7_9PLAT|nr:unnamed protein product [Protopolystoma xenopodis]
MSLVTGRIRDLLHQPSMNQEAGCGDLVPRNPADWRLIEACQSQVSNRTWFGLDPRIGLADEASTIKNIDVTAIPPSGSSIIEVGKHGLPRGYTTQDSDTHT